MAIKPLPVVKERIVENTEPIDLTPYRFFGTRILLEIPTEAIGSEYIVYTKLNFDIWFKVSAVGNTIDSTIISVGDFVLINPDLPPNQVPVVLIEGRKFLSLEWHEVMVVRDKNHTPTYNDKTDATVE